MIVIKHEQRYPNDSHIYVSYFKGCEMGFLNYSNIDNAKEYTTIDKAKQDFAKYQLNPEKHKYIVK